MAERLLNDLFTLTLSKPVQEASLLIIDATGREVVRMVMSGDRTSVNTSVFAQGVFSYRLIDHHSDLLAQGNWVKQ